MKHKLLEIDLFYLIILVMTYTGSSDYETWKEGLDQRETPTLPATYNSGNPNYETWKEGIDQREIPTLPAEYQRGSDSYNERKKRD